MTASTRTEVVIVGGGPAGLMLSHLLHLVGIGSVVIDNRTVAEISTTHRAGILERDSVRLLSDSGASSRVLTDGVEHEGISLRFSGVNHRLDFQELVGASCWLYPQTEVFVDLYQTRIDDGGDVRYGVSDTEVFDVDDRSRIRYRIDGVSHEISADVVVGADGSRGICRALVDPRNQYFREYPFAWFGVLVEAPPSHPELIYARSDAGFALLSQRSNTVQRMYFQCDRNEDVAEWSDDRIWAEFHQRLAGTDGFELAEGPVIEKSVLPFRSFVQSPMHQDNLILIGDAAHTVPPTGAKGLNLALADARLAAEVIERALRKSDDSALGEYTDRALRRVWRAQQFSYWMTTMLHRAGDATEFDDLRQLGELRSLVSSHAGSAYFAEGYTGWPQP